MQHLASIALTLGALTIASGSAFSAPTIITFGEIRREIGDRGPIVESGYQYEAVGSSWSIQDGQPFLDQFPSGNALCTFWGIPPTVGNVITFARLDNSPFVFQSLELRGRLDQQRNDVVMARGFLNGMEIGSQLFQSSNEVWRVQSAGSSFAGAAIDTLRFELIESNQAALIFDNLVFAPVPEPAAWALLAIGAPVVAWIRNARVRK